MPTSQQNVDRQDRLARIVALFLAVAIAVFTPVAIILVGYTGAVDLRRMQAEITARRIAEYAYVQGPSWRFSEHRVAELVRQIAPAGDPGLQIITASQGGDPIVVGEPPISPFARIETPIICGAEHIGTLAIESSLRPLAFDAALALLVGLLIGAGTYVLVRFPLDRLRAAVGELIRTETELDFQVDRGDEAEKKIAQLNSDLHQASRVAVLGEMATNFAEQLNQPLNAIVNYAAGSRRRLTRGEDLQSSLPPILENMETEARRAGEIIQGIGGFVSREKPSYRRFEFREVLHDVLEFVAPKALEHNVRLVLETGCDEDCSVRGNRVQIQQVFVNLIRNAFEALSQSGPDNRRINIRVIKGAHSVEVRIEDNGPGLRHEDDGKLFDPFHTGKPDGMGLGLTICRTIITQHGGTIWGTNSPVGGAVFMFTIPLPEDGDGDEETSDATAD